MSCRYSYQQVDRFIDDASTEILITENPLVAICNQHRQASASSYADGDFRKWLASKLLAAYCAETACRKTASPETPPGCPVCRDELDF